MGIFGSIMAKKKELLDKAELMKKTNKERQVKELEAKAEKAAERNKLIDREQKAKAVLKSNFEKEHPILSKISKNVKKGLETKPGENIFGVSDKDNPWKNGKMIENSSNKEKMSSKKSGKTLVIKL